MSKRIYTVSDGDRTEVLVRASSRSQAISHVARKIFRSRVATQGDLEWVTAEANTRHFHDSGRWKPTPKFLGAVCKNAVLARAAKRAKGARA